MGFKKEIQCWKDKRRVDLGGIEGTDGYYENTMDRFSNEMNVWVYMHICVICI